MTWTHDDDMGKEGLMEGGGFHQNTGAIAAKPLNVTVSNLGAFFFTKKKDNKSAADDTVSARELNA